MSTGRVVPTHIDKSSRGLECAMVFMLPLVFIRPFYPATGFLLALALPPIYMWLTIGKPDGYLLHKLRRVGLPIPGLMDRKIRRLHR